MEQDSANKPASININEFFGAQGDEVQATEAINPDEEKCVLQCDMKMR